MHIRRIQIENIRALSALDLDLTGAGAPARCRVLIGPNGIGKSTLLDCFGQVLGQISSDLDAERLDSEDIRDGTATAKVEVDLQLSPSEQRRAGAVQDSLRLRWDWKSPSLAEAIFSWNSPSLADTIISRIIAGAAMPDRHARDPRLGVRKGDTLTGKVPLTTGDVATGVTALGSQPTPFLLLPANRGVLQWDPELPLWLLAGERPRGNRNLPGPFSRDPQRWRPLAALLGIMHQRSPNDEDALPFHRSWAAISQHFPTFPKPSHVKNLKLWFKTPSGAVIPIHRLSDGERALLLILAELAHRRVSEGVVLIDEPEQHLHPGWNQPLLLCLQELYPGVQFIYTTHAPMFALAAGENRLNLGDADANG